MNLEKAVDKSLKIAQNISSAWLLATYEEKQQLQKLVFPDGMLYNKQKKQVRTPRINSLFAAIEPLVKVSIQNKNGDPVTNRQKF